jgi:undecaprenyl-diphosphatase
LLLFLADRAKKTHKKVSYVDAAVIGIAQAIAILPGISRSGATISTSVLLGIDRDQAARFSFLMVVPLILGKMIVDSRDLFAMPQQEQEAHLLPLLAGFLAAFVTGLWACKLMINLVKKAKLSGFAIYCIAVGTLAAFWVL